MEIDLEEMAKSLPPAALPVLRDNGYLDADRLQVGDSVPRIELIAREDGTITAIGGAGTGLPTALIFGSYT